MQRKFTDKQTFMIFYVGGLLSAFLSSFTLNIVLEAVNTGFLWNIIISYVLFIVSLLLMLYSLAMNQKYLESIGKHN